MKRLWTVFALVMVMFASCDNEIENAEEPMQGEEVTVKIGFDGEILDISEGPLETKVSGNDLYGVQVYCKPSNGSDYVSYAYGLFDDPSEMEIKLLAGYKYRFEATMIEDGVNVIGRHYNSGFGIVEFSSPFNETLENKFKYSNKEGFSPYSSWTYLQTKEDYYHRPNIMRYYGELNNYTPLTSESSVNIDMYKVVFGAKFNFMNLTEGKVDVNISEAPGMSVNYPQTSVEDIFTFDGIGFTFESPEGEYIPEGMPLNEEIITVSITWTKTDGVIVPVYNGPIKFNRNKQTIVTVNLDQESESLGTKVEIDLEDTPMTPGEEVTINPGDQVAG